MGVLDIFIVNVVLLIIVYDLEVLVFVVIWVVNVYYIVGVVIMMSFVVFGGVVGCKRVYVVGLVVFIVMLLGCVMFGLLVWLVVFCVV